VTDAPKRLLFVCVENSCRSQMAESFARALGGARVESHSAGSRPSGEVHPRAIAFMRELGHDLSLQRSTSVRDVSGVFDAVVTMGCGDACPAVPAARREDWDLPDPKHLDDAGFRAVRDRIASKVAELLAALGVPVARVQPPSPSTPSKSGGASGTGPRP
jgi:protein-tyrosine-phosphatase